MSALGPLNGVNAGPGRTSVQRVQIGPQHQEYVPAAAGAAPSFFSSGFAEVVAPGNENGAGAGKPVFDHGMRSNRLNIVLSLTSGADGRRSSRRCTVLIAGQTEGS